MKYKKEVYRSLTLILQFGINMLVPIFLCSFFGWYVDRRLNTSFIFIIMFFVGALAGGRNIYIMARQIFAKKDGNAGGHEDMDLPSAMDSGSDGNKHESSEKK